MSYLNFLDHMKFDQSTRQLDQTLNIFVVRRSIGTPDSGLVHSVDST